MPSVRRGTRISYQMRITVRSLDGLSFHQPCVTLVVNPQGCALRCGRPLELGTRVRLEDLPSGQAVTAKVVNCISLGKYENFWILGLNLDEPGNVWGVANPPEDWSLACTEISSGA